MQQHPPCKSGRVRPQLMPLGAVALRGGCGSNDGSSVGASTQSLTPQAQPPGGNTTGGNTTGGNPPEPDAGIFNPV